MGKFYVLSLLALSVLSSSLRADDIEVLGFKARGKLCRRENAFFIQNGEAFSILFSRFGIDLVAGNRTGGHVEVKTCVVTLDLRLPTDRCLNGTEQLIRGGVLKSKDTYGWVYAGYSMPGISDAKQIWFRYGNEILPEESESLFELELRDSGPRHCVTGRVRYYLVLQQGAWRRSIRNDFYNSNLDSVDGEVLLRVKTR